MQNQHLIDPFYQMIYTNATMAAFTALCIIAAAIVYHQEKPFIHYHYKKVTICEYLFTQKFCPLWLSRIYLVSGITIWATCIMFIVGELMN